MAKPTTDWTERTTQTGTEWTERTTQVGTDWTEQTVDPGTTDWTAQASREDVADRENDWAVMEQYWDPKTTNQLGGYQEGSGVAKRVTQHYGPRWGWRLKTNEMGASGAQTPWTTYP